MIGVSFELLNDTKVLLILKIMSIFIMLERKYSFNNKNR